MRGIVERHGGTVEKFIGDAVVAVFGVPVAHEDDALRACRGGGGDAGRAAGARDRGRIGVNTGEVVATTGDLLATGDAVNVAARLEQTARPGEVLVGELTYSLARGCASVEQVEPLVLKEVGAGARLPPARGGGRRQRLAAGTVPVHGPRGAA